MNDSAGEVAPELIDDVEAAAEMGAAEDEPRTTDWLEVVATTLLGIAAVVIAFATFQAQLWGGVQDTRNTASSTISVEAASAMGRADAIVSLDQLLFADWVPAIVGAIEANEAIDAGASPSEEAALRAEADFRTNEAGFLKSQMSAAGKRAATSWLANQLTRPFDEGAYTSATYGDSLAQFEASGVLFDMAVTANGTSDDYTLAATIVALVLFLAGVSLVLNGHATRMILVLLSGLILVGVIVAVLGLPRESEAQTVDEITDDAVLKASSRLFIPAEGESAFNVYLEVSDDPEAEFTDVVELYEAEGYTVLTGNIACDVGAAEALGVDDDSFAATISFAASDDAAEFAAEYQLADEMIVEVRNECAIDPSLDSLDVAPVTPSLGDAVVGVYLDVSDDPDADFADVVDFYWDEGYTVFTGSVACDLGAAEALGIDDESVVAAVYFANPEAASGFAGAFGLADEAVAEVQITWC